MFQIGPPLPPTIAYDKSSSGTYVKTDIGVFYQDYYYDKTCYASNSVSNNWRYLNEFNGHDHDNMGFHYHMTVDTGMNPIFPYTIGPMYYGYVGGLCCYAMAGTNCKGTSTASTATGTTTKGTTTNACKGFAPTLYPTREPSAAPTREPSEKPTKDPTEEPTFRPTYIPTPKPSFSPTKDPTDAPSKYPTITPTVMPTNFPTNKPTAKPTPTPTKSPVTPTAVPSVATGSTATSVSSKATTTLSGVSASSVNTRRRLADPAMEERRRLAVDAAFADAFCSSVIMSLGQSGIYGATCTVNAVNSAQGGAACDVVYTIEMMLDSKYASADALTSAMSTAVTNSVSSGTFSATLAASGLEALADMGPIYAMPFISTVTVLTSAPVPTAPVKEEQILPDLLSNQSVVGLIAGAVVTGILLIGILALAVKLYLNQGKGDYHSDLHEHEHDHSEHEFGVEMKA